MGAQATLNSALSSDGTSLTLVQVASSAGAATSDNSENSIWNRVLDSTGAIRVTAVA